MATVGLSDEHYKSLKALSQETGKPIQKLADYFIGECLKKATVKEIKTTTKQLVMEN